MTVRAGCMYPQPLTGLPPNMRPTHAPLCLSNAKEPESPAPTTRQLENEWHKGAGATKKEFVSGEKQSTPNQA